MKRELIRTDRNGTKYYKVTCKCGKCGGTGRIPYFHYIQDGECFDCGGSGIQQYEEKEYTPEYEAKLEARRKARQEKKDAEARQASEEVNKEFFKQQGFNEDGKTYVVLGNTYEIKDQLKELGCRFEYGIGWHSANRLEGYPQLEADVEEIFTRNKRTNQFDWRDKNISDDLFKRIEEANKEIKSLQEGDKEYIAEVVGEKVDIEVTLDKSYCFPTQYYNTDSYIYNFKDAEGNVIVWKTSKFIGVEEGETVRIAGKVKELTEYKGTKQTVLTRCKITK